MESIARRVENSVLAGIYAKGPAVAQLIMLRPFWLSCKQSHVGRMALYSSFQVICDSYIDKSLCSQLHLMRALSWISP